jgi:hypothetical protein
MDTEIITEDARKISVYLRRQKMVSIQMTLIYIPSVYQSDLSRLYIRESTENLYELHTGNIINEYVYNIKLSISGYQINPFGGKPMERSYFR